MQRLWSERVNIDTGGHDAPDERCGVNVDALNVPRFRGCRDGSSRSGIAPSHSLVQEAGAFAVQAGSFPHVLSIVKRVLRPRGSRAAKLDRAL
jgi:hypothetical protein